MKTFQIRTLGCKVNQYESQLLREQLLRAGLIETENKSDICIVNTCTVTQKADKESRGLIHKAYNQNSKSKIFVTGCSAQNSREDLEKGNGVSCVIENIDKEKILEFIFDNKTRNKQARYKKHDTEGITKFEGHTRAFVKIQDGCNNACSYCIVPKVRGRSRNRPLTSIIEEVKNLVTNGYKEIVLCGICLGAYGKDLQQKSSLAEVINKLEDIDGLLRIRLSSIEAKDVDSELIKKLVSSKKLCHHLHIPFQSGDNKILKLMNRKLKTDNYLKLIYNLRKHCPDIAITTDIIVGFPQEDKTCFDNTVNFLKKSRPSRIHVFSFSPREGTKAFDFKDTVPNGIIKERAVLIKELSRKLSYGFYEKYIGKKLSILVEATPDPQTNLYKGYSDNYIKVFLTDTKVIANKVVTIRVLKKYRDGVLATLA